jgi:S1-C subfamily serine protease
VRNADDLVRIVTNVLRPGQTAVFSVIRSSGRQTVAVKLTAR